MSIYEMSLYEMAEHRIQAQRANHLFVCNIIPMI